jgi:drug/metabolite transporter (DMT)-like permease
MLHGVRAILWAALLWSSGGLFIKWAPLPGLLVAGGRALVTAVFYLAVWRPDLRRARWPTAVAYAGMIVTFVLATKQTSAANAILLQYTGTAWVLVLAPRLLGEPLRRVDVLTVAVCLGGMALCLGGGGRWQGDLLGAVSGLFFAWAILGMRSDAATEGRDPQASTTVGNLLAAAVALPCCTGDWPLLADGRALAVLAWLGIVQMGLAYWVFIRGVRTVPAATASVLALIEPVLNPLWVFLGTGERPGLATMAGGAVVLASLGGREWWLRRTTIAQQPTAD